MMTTMTAHSRTASDELRRELGLSQAELPPSQGPTSCGVAAITRDNATGELLVACVCGTLGYGATEDVARADLANAHLEVDGG
jgi:hypothetical protein